MKMSKTYQTILVTAILISALTAAYSQNSQIIQTATTLSVKPLNIIDPSLIPGDTFTINCSVSDVVDLYTWQVKLFFDPAVLNCTGAWYPSDHVFAGMTMIPVVPIIDNVAGHILYGCSLMGAAAGFEGSGTLCQIEFKIKDVGESGINYSEPYGGDTYLLNYDLDEIPAEVQDGYFNNKPALPEYTLTITTTAGGTTEPAPGSYTYREGTDVSVLAVPHAGYSFDHWELDGVNYTMNPITVTMDTNHTLDATFLTGPPPPEYTLTITSTAGGTTDPSPGSYSYPEGTGVSVLAVPDAGYSFDGWELEGATHTVNPITVTMDANYTLHAVFEIAPETTIYVDPSEIIDPTLVPSSTFSVNISINYVENLRIYRLNLSYDTNVLSWIGVKVFKIQNVTPTANAIMNDEAGYVYLNVTYPIPVTTATPKALFMVIFHVDAFGSSILDLHDTELLDENGNPIPHEAIDGYFCSLFRDVSITHVVPSRDWAYVGWKLNITVTAKNLGNLTETFDVGAYYDDQLIGTVPVTDLPPEAEVNVTIIWDTSGVPEGNYTIKALATEVPYEYNTTNNILIDGKVWIMELIHDVAVTNVTFPYNWAYPGWHVNITVTVQNMGNYSETFDVKLFSNSQLMYTHHVMNLPTGQETTFTYTWDTSALQLCTNYTISAEATQVPYEYNTANNIFVVDVKFKIRLLGDVNDDGKVDMMDIAIAQVAFGTFPSDPRWNPAADVNMDYRVDLRDIAIIAHNFGKTC